MTQIRAWLKCIIILYIANTILNDIPYPIALVYICLDLLNMIP